MTVGEIERRMTTRELAEWIAYTYYYQAIEDSWAQTGLIVSSVLAPHCEGGKGPDPANFIPIKEAPKHELQDYEAVLALRNALGYE